MPQRSTYLISYDIVSSRRRTKVLDLLRNYGLPVQRSIVECEATPPELEYLRLALRRLIRPREDQVRIYLLCQACLVRSEVIGAERPGAHASRDSL